MHTYYKFVTCAVLLLYMCVFQTFIETFSIIKNFHSTKMYCSIEITIKTKTSKMVGCVYYLNDLQFVD